MKYIISALFIASAFISSSSYAQSDTPSIFVTHERNGDSFINSIGAGLNFKANNSNLGGQVNMSLGQAEVVTTRLDVQDYLAWELGVKVGYFSDVSLYLEAGLDLGELIDREHLREDDYDTHRHITIDGDHVHIDEYRHSYRNIEDSLDAYMGIGGGITIDRLSIKGQVRYRQIDSDDWEALDDVYSGVTVSFSF